MGISLGIGSIRLGNASQSWSSYWTPQKIAATFLFDAFTKDIVGGKLYNTVKGREAEYLTVTGSAGSYHYTCPNNATYIAADTDYAWFKTDGSVSDMTDSRLNSYDLQRTPVLFDNNSPNINRRIAILLPSITLVAGKLLDEIFKRYQLPIEWHNNTNGYGHIKDNRTGQNLWTPESVYIGYDTFTGVDGTRLNAHTMDVGAGWTEDSGIWTIGTNRATQTTDSVSNNFVIFETGKADFDISLDVRIPSLVSFACYGGLVFRYQDITHSCRCIIENEGGSLYVNLTYDGTSLGQYSISWPGANAIITLRVVTLGNSIKVYVNGDLQIDVSNATYNDKTKVGIMSYVHSFYVAMQFDNFIVK